MTSTAGEPRAAVTDDHARCPVLNRDFSAPLKAGSYWREADELREAGPVFFNRFAQGYWIFTRDEQVRDIYKHPEIFSTESITPWDPEPAYRFIPTQVDAPDHIKYRRIVNPWFAPEAIHRAGDVVRSTCRRLIEEIAPLGSHDFATGFGLRYPTEVFLAMLGVDTSDAEKFVSWIEDFFGGFGGDAAGLEPMAKALDAIREYWVAALDERRGEPAPREGDLASHLLHASFDERPLTDQEILDMLTVLVLAGLDTTRASLGYLFRHLAAHPEHRRRLIDEPALIPSAVEEALRFYTIIFGDGRKVARDTEFHGVSLRRGDMVYGLVSGANRDPRRYDRADEYVIDRERSNHLTFASGPHKCLGLHLARREMQVAVEEWLRVIPDFSVATTEPLLERGGGAMMTLLNLPLVWDTIR